MINPSQITDFNRGPYELQEFLLFCISVAGKNAVTQAQKLEEFLAGRSSLNVTPFAHVRTLDAEGRLRSEMERVKLGKYGLLVPGFRAAALLDDRLTQVDRKELAELPGVGLKTASFFLLHSRPAQRLAVLDTYVLKFIGRTHPKMVLPPTSPQRLHRYLELESVFLGECLKSGQLDPAQADLNCWNSRGHSLS